MTIGELAELVGMSVRNVRAHQSRGLLPRPRRRGRRAYYTGEHARRLRRIRDLQQQGYNLAAIRGLLEVEESPEAASGLLRLALSPLLADDDRLLVPVERLAEMFRSPVDPEGRLEAMRLGLLRDAGDGMVEITSRALARLAAAFIEAGATGPDVFRLQRRMLADTRAVAEEFVELCLRHARAQLADPPEPERGLRQLRERVERLQALGAQVLLATFSLQARQATERALRHDGR